jgi:hypothetical protein
MLSTYHLLAISTDGASKSTLLVWRPGCRILLAGTELAEGGEATHNVRERDVRVDEGGDVGTGVTLLKLGVVVHGLELAYAGAAARILLPPPHGQHPTRPARATHRRRAREGRRGSPPHESVAAGIGAPRSARCLPRIGESGIGRFGQGFLSLSSPSSAREIFFLIVFT